jgi:hypothetical protein
MSIYKNFIEEKGYDLKLQECIQKTVDHLEQMKTDVRNPGMLLGKIQSGKTRTFIGVIALAFDRGYDIAVVLTKGTRVLAEQTFKRLESEFTYFIDDDQVKVYDIMNLPILTAYLRKQKLIIVVKKETKNLDRLANFFDDYPDLVQKKTLIIDDEADFASIGYRRDKAQPDGISINVLATKLSGIRNGFENNYDYLQVTATPYSLYLQPSAIKVNNEEYAPVRPKFTELVPIHNRYVGGEFYFDESSNPQSPAYYLHIEIPLHELAILGKSDRRYISNIMTTPNLEFFRFAVMNYLVGGTIRILQERRNQKRYKSSFIIHTETAKAKHAWQLDLASSLMEKLSELNKEQMHDLVKDSYEQFVLSLTVNESFVPEFEAVLGEVFSSIKEGYIGINKVNSDNEVFALLGKDGQLRLDNPFNIFIGGQILDRGITVENLIGFFYGRNPKKFQQDTVLQHSRMYGARSMDDMAVTRFYTSANIYTAMRKMHEFDSLLREAFEKGINNDKVIFVERDPNGTVVPCAPNKILITSTETLKPFKRFLPVGFQTKPKSTISTIVKKVDEILYQASKGNIKNPFAINLSQAEHIIRLIDSTLEYSERWDNVYYQWDKDVFLSLIRRFNSLVTNPTLQNTIYCIVRSDRNISRYKQNRYEKNGLSFTDAPDDNRTDYTEAKNVATEIPCLMLLKQNGKESQGWRETEFWWPVLVAPQNTRSAIFATETLA